MKNFNEKIRNAVALIQERDPELIVELRSSELSVNANVVMESAAVADNERFIAFESIVLRKGRPVLTVFNNEAVIEIDTPESEMWRQRIDEAKNFLDGAIIAVGRVELENDPSYKWVGTAWYVDDNIIVTNRHVAEVFSQRNGSTFVFKQGLGGKEISASIDMLEEAGQSTEIVFNIDRVLYIEDSSGADIAFLSTIPDPSKTKINPIPLSNSIPVISQFVATIGYPAYDSRIPDIALMKSLFGDLYDKKRLAPGQITGISNIELMHDCTTLGGNSGSVIVDLKTGEALGLHFAGRFLENNYAVPANVILSKLRKMKLSFSEKEDSHLDNFPLQSSPTIHLQQRDCCFTIPIKVTVSIDDGLLLSPNSRIPSFPIIESESDVIIEAKPADYADREGYDKMFIGQEIHLPAIKDQHKKDILTFKLNGQTESELKYMHFSVVMNKKRRQCFFSAVNIDGKTSVPARRGPWRYDPRISEKFQIMKECYGNAPKFSRGHMTRREDPIWGSMYEAATGNSDSMHVTNTVPQMQSMNAGIWLQLENYALQNARKDDMRIAVFTGPYFADQDPIKYGVQIPLSFWKVIAFIHDDTNELCATGYSISQKSYIQEEEFIFGVHGTEQVSISSIESNSGINFGHLSSVDPFSKDTEGVHANVAKVIENMHSIKFY